MARQWRGGIGTWYLVAALALASTGGAAVTISPDSMAEARRWSAAAFEGRVMPPLAVGLTIERNYDLVQKRARFGRPLRLAGKEHTRGLFCHADSRIVVRLPAPGRAFEAVAGVDSNEQTSGGRGSVVFGVEVGGKQAYRSPVVREGLAAERVTVPLDGAREFALTVGDGGDGIACDQADWADARVTLQDGRVVWLDDLPCAGGPAVANASQPPFSFTYGGRAFADLAAEWPVTRSSRELPGDRVERRVTYADPTTGLRVLAVAVEYRHFPTVEWTVYLKNTGPEPTPIVEKLRALDIAFERGHYGEFTLHHAVGSPCAPNDYAPLTTPLEPNARKRIGAAGGRPSDSDMPYFNLEAPTGHGVIIAVGWPGQWSSAWERDPGLGLRLAAGQETTRFRLLPGEEVRTPLAVLQFWNGDWTDAQNVWRRWMLAHNVPRDGGALPRPELFGCSSHQLSEMEKATEANQKDFIDGYLRERIGIGRWWMDAGWYPCDGVGWPLTGTWEVDARRFPNGLRAISDHAHERGVKTILWFEPERVHPGSWLARNRPEWVLGGAAGGLLNLGDPAARTWITDRVDRILTDEGIDLYRQDFNMDPLPYWTANDAPDRQGITEIRHVEGYLGFWDELQRRHPGMLIDTCASGGRRNDLETLRRAIPLWRTDWRCEPIGTQSCTYGISMWIPLSGTGAEAIDPYLFRSNMAPFTNLLVDVRDRQLPYDRLRELTAQWARVADLYTADFYPLTAYTVSSDAWMAWQFNRPETGEGVVQAFRRDQCVFEVGRLKLRGLDPGARYRVTDADGGRPRVVAGRELMETGLRVTIASQPGAVILHYRRVRG